MNLRQKICTLMLLISSTSPLYGYNPKNQEYGFFDLSVGPSFLEDAQFGKKLTEYQLGPCISSSIGLTHANGLGIGLNYLYTYNSKYEALPPSGAAAVIDTNESTDASMSAIKLSFIYKIVANSDISLIINAGPCLMATNDQNLRIVTIDEPTGTSSADTASGAANVAITLSDASTGQNTAQVSVATGSQAGDTQTSNQTQAEGVSNFSFGYNVSAGLEYRQDRHKAYGLEFGYVNSHLYKSTYEEDTKDTRITSQKSASLESTYANLLIRYYI